MGVVRVVTMVEFEEGSIGAVVARDVAKDVQRTGAVLARDVAKDVQRTGAVLARLRFGDVAKDAKDVYEV